MHFTHSRATFRGSVSKAQFGELPHLRAGLDGLIAMTQILMNIYLELQA